MSPHLVVMGLVFAGAILVGFLLLPDDNERIAMLERDGHDRQARELLEQRYAAGDRSVRTLFQLQGLYEESGNLARAGALLESLASARPRDATVQRRLAEFYRATQNEAGYIRTLEARLAARFSQPVCRELIGLHRRAGNYDAEAQALATCSARGYRRTDDVIRLAHLTAVEGRLADAAVLLRSVDDRRRLRQDSDRLMLFSTLVEAGEAEEAKRRAGRWFKGSKDDALVLQIIDTLSSSNRHDLAVDLAREVGKPGDSISLAVAELMLDREQVVAARTYLRGWLEAARLSDEEVVQRLLRAALAAEDPMLAYQAAEMFGLGKLEQDDLVALAEALSAIDQRAAFDAVRATIAPANLRENLLLAAAVEVERGQPEPARQLLSRVQVKALDEWRLALWARLMASTGREATAQQTLRDIAAEIRSSGAAANVPLLPPVVEAAMPPPGPLLRPPGIGAPSKADVGDPRRRILKRGRVDAKRTPPRRSRLKKGPAEPPAPSPGSAPVPIPFPSSG